MTDLRNDPQFQEFERKVKKDLIPKIKDSNIFVSITPDTPDKVDVKFAVELGLAIMMDKPIVATISPGTKIPEKLAKVVDRFIEMDPDNPGAMVDALQETVKEMEEGGEI